MPPLRGWRSQRRRVFRVVNIMVTAGRTEGHRDIGTGTHTAKTHPEDKYSHVGTKQIYHFEKIQPFYCLFLYFIYNGVLLVTSAITYGAVNIHLILFELMKKFLH